jgi:hypothetical protein
MPKYRQVDLDSAHPVMSAAIRQHHFYRWWASDTSDRQELFEIVNAVRRTCDLPAYTWAKFDEGWQYRTCGHRDYRVARAEMFNLCFGWW